MPCLFVILLFIVILVEVKSVSFQKIIYSFLQMLRNITLNIRIHSRPAHTQYRHLIRIQYFLLLIKLLNNQLSKRDCRNSQNMPMRCINIFIVKHDYVSLYVQLYLCNGLAGLVFVVNVDYL